MSGAVEVRFAEATDLPLLQAIEDDGERAFDGLMDHSHWGPSLTGEERAAEPGFMLVAGRPPVGYAHVLDLDGHLHLEQLDVLASHRRRGVGSALVQEVCRVAASRGAREVTLLTFAEVPFNGPFYARLGFAEVPEPLLDFLAPLRENEKRIGLDAGGRRIAMRRTL
ncbi:GNAT family N-acetyltransferase [Knoellia koreensis]|uniref:GNAT family N-acetyltransferase n=1 Tax=Knoellia koreensis TaxID=2730921 RepID=A0A849HCF3_9MICO|nr:GNAT family N-acetyltransferase [Knoellia sp. DB2414S]NNM44729.1 GNAT family N-acetyltransferase [Knoellia sp. DB2414S]